MAIKITVNGELRSTSSAPDTPLLYVLRDDLELRGPKFGCGLSQCGACAVLVDGKETRSCVTPVAAVVGKQVTTLEGLPAWYAKQQHLGMTPALHPLQQAWIDEQVPQCGYCQSGMIIMAADLLSRNAHPSEAVIKQTMDPHLCRCATHNAIVRAIKRAANSTA
jgi:isoquinoline 1-oxidoreductase subunit alpha